MKKCHFVLFLLILFSLSTSQVALCQGNWEDDLSNPQTWTTGKVGIGTTNPAFQLSLGSSTTRTKLALYETGADNSYGLGVVPGALRLHLNGSGARFAFFDGDEADAKEIVTIQGKGNVGIGTRNPASKLEVRGTIHSTAGGIKFPDNTVQETAGGSSIIYSNNIQVDVSPRFSIAGGHTPISEKYNRIAAPRNGRLENLFVVASDGRAPGQDVTVTVRVNGADTDLSVTMPGGATQVVSNTVNSVAVSSGDVISIKFLGTWNVAAYFTASFVYRQ